MTLRWARGSASERQRGRLIAAALLLALTLGAPTGRGEEADPFSTTIAVDATADTVAKARDMARLDGQRRALAAVAAQLAGGAPAKLPKLDDKAITELVASFEVANERMSSVRYAADYTFHFRPDEVRRVLGNLTSAASDDGGKPAIMLPVYQSPAGLRLWDDPNPWRQAWEQRPADSGGPRLVMPLGDAGDVAAIDSDKARAGDTAALAAIAKRNGGEDVLTAVAALRGSVGNPGGVDVTVRRYRAGRLIDSHGEAVAANPGESESALLRRAAAAVVSDIASGWKREAAPPVDQQGTLTAVLPITDLDDWLRTRERLAGVPAVRKIALMALSRQEATIEIGYAGSIDALQTALAKISLDLVRGDPLWRLAYTGPARGQ